MPLRRLTRFSKLELEKEKDELERTIEALDAILADDQLLRKVVSDELAEVAKTFGTPRRTVLLESAGRHGLGRRRRRSRSPTTRASPTSRRPGCSPARPRDEPPERRGRPGQPRRDRLGGAHHRPRRDRRAHLARARRTPQRARPAGAARARPTTRTSRAGCPSTWCARSSTASGCSRCARCAPTGPASRSAPGRAW